MAEVKIGTGRVLPRMLVVRTGWMTHYAGSIPDDEQPRRGGAYNVEKMGHELFNFLNLDGTLHGYAESPKSKGFNLRRIDPSANGDRLERVLVIFIATNPQGGQVVVGWSVMPRSIASSSKKRIRAGLTRAFILDFILKLRQPMRSCYP
jgi:hypothetical protein